MSAADQSPRTVTERARLVERFARVTGTDPVTCDWRPVADFLATPTFSRSTRQQYRAILKSWFGFLVLMDVRPDNPVDKLPKVRVPRRVPRPITEDQVVQVLASSRYYARTRAMLILAIFMGMRAVEISRIRGEHFTGGNLRIVGKGDAERVMPVHPAVAELAERMPRIGLWFTSPANPGQPVTAKNVSRVLSEAIRRAGVDASGHQCRHFYATAALMAAGGNLRHVQELLGHASVATTQIYTKVHPDGLRATVEGIQVPLYVVEKRRRAR